MFEKPSGVEFVENTANIPFPQLEPDIDPQPQRSGWRNLFNLFQTPSTDVDVEAQVCRPNQNQFIMPVRRQVEAASDKIFIERNQLLINGEEISIYFEKHES